MSEDGLLRPAGALDDSSQGTLIDRLLPHLDDGPEFG